MPDETARDDSTSTCVMGRAGVTVAAGAVRPARADGDATSTVPQAWHSPHRPTHLLVVHPHSAQA